MSGGAVRMRPRVGGLAVSAVGQQSYVGATFIPLRETFAYEQPAMTTQRPERADIRLPTQPIIRNTEHVQGNLAPLDKGTTFGALARHSPPSDRRQIYYVTFDVQITPSAQTPSTKDCRNFQCTCKIENVQIYARILQIASDGHPPPSPHLG